jgi:hypothetical protein
MQTQWPGLGPNFDLASLDAPAAGGPALWPNDAAFGASQPAPADAIARPWWTCGTANANGGGALGSLLGGSGANGSLFGMLSGLMAALQQLLGTFTNATTSSGSATPWHAATGSANGGNAAGPNGACAGGNGKAASRVPGIPGGPEQRFADVDVSSTGDPHLAEVGTRAGAGPGRAVDAHWDDMYSHDDLLHTDQIDGGYRVSTAVTQPDANGVTYNRSASVHANFGADDVTMERDGSYRIFDDGHALALGKGESATLSGGERVDVNADGSVTVNAANGAATIATTLRSTGNGVDVTTHAHDLRLGGDAIAHGTRTAQAAPAG